MPPRLATKRQKINFAVQRSDSINANLPVIQIFIANTATIKDQYQSTATKQMDRPLEQK